MKRFVVSLIACGMVCICLTACGSSAQSAPSGSSNASTSTNSASAAVISSSKSSSAAESAQPIELNQTVKTDDYELTLTGVEWTNEVREQTSDNSSWYFTADNRGGETMLVVRCTFKNLGASDYSTSAMDVNFKVNDKYDLKGTASSHKPSISPLSTEEVYLCTATSNEMKDTFKDGTMTLKLKSCTNDGNMVKIGSDSLGEYVLKIAA